MSFTTNIIVIGASIRYGKHKPEVAEFVDRHQTELDARPNAFFTVNVVARKPGKDTPDTNPYLKGFRRKTTWRPALLGVFAAAGISTVVDMCATRSYSAGLT